jgi:hypothetical protein
MLNAVGRAARRRWPQPTLARRPNDHKEPIMGLVLILLVLIAFIVFSTVRWKLHPFLALLAAAILAGFAYRVPVGEILTTVASGFGGILGYIGIVIALGTIIGVILERSGAAITMAESVIRLLGERFPTLTLSIIGYLVSIPVFCDSGYVILNSLKNALAARMKVSVVAMSVALATGLYATHTFVPPTPGPIAAAGNLGLQGSLGLVIAVGLVVSALAALADAGLGLGDVDGLFCTLMEDSMPVLMAAEYLGIQPRYVDGTMTGGSSFVNNLTSATLALQAGLCDVALICYGSNQRTASGRLVTASKLPPYEQPYSPRYPLAAYAMAAARHMYQYGTTREQLR